MQYHCTAIEGPLLGESWLTEKLQVYVDLVDRTGAKHAHRLGSLVGMNATYLYDDPSKIALAKRPNLPKDIPIVHVATPSSDALSQRAS